MTVSDAPYNAPCVRIQRVCRTHRECIAAILYALPCRDRYSARYTTRSPATLDPKSARRGRAASGERHPVRRRVGRARRVAQVGVVRRRIDADVADLVAESLILDLAVVFA